MNDKNLSNSVIWTSQDWLLPVYKQMKKMIMEKSFIVPMGIPITGCIKPFLA